VLPVVFPVLENEFFGRGSAILAGLFSGAPVVRVDSGWWVGMANAPVVVTTACSATDYFTITTLLIAWQLHRTAGRTVVRAVLGLVMAVPLTLGVNAFRIVVVTQLQNWTGALLPAIYGHFVHLLIGVAVFLPSLIALNLLLEIYGKSRVSLDPKT